MDEGEKEVDPQEEKNLEEGEIVDYFDMISSEEESSMRARIQELEEKNMEIEQITVISKSFANPHDYACHYDSYKANHDYSNTNSRISPYQIISKNRFYDMRRDDDSDDVSRLSLDEMTATVPNIAMAQKRSLNHRYDHRRRKRHKYSSRTRLMSPIKHHQYYYQSAYNSHRNNDYENYLYYNMNDGYKNYPKLPTYTPTDEEYYLKRRIHCTENYEHLLPVVKHKRLSHRKLPKDIKCTSNFRSSNEILSNCSKVSPISDSDNQRTNDFHLDRESLHLAITRNTNNSNNMTNERIVEITKNNSGNLRERLLPRAQSTRSNVSKSSTRSKSTEHEKDFNPNVNVEDIIESANKQDIKQDHDNQNEESVTAKSSDMVVSNNDSDSLDEKELRLVALKSAVLRKHQRRKYCRDPQTAYSPTDFEAMVNSGIMDDDVQCDVDLNIIDQASNEESLSPCTTINSLGSPKFQFAKTHEDAGHSSVVNTKLIDMELDNSTSQEEDNSNEWGNNAMNNLNHIFLPVNKNVIVNNLVPFNYSDCHRNLDLANENFNPAVINGDMCDTQGFQSNSAAINNPMLFALEKAEYTNVHDQYLNLYGNESSMCLPIIPPKPNNDQMQQEMDICTPLSVLSENNGNEEGEDDDCILVSEIWPKRSDESKDDVIVLLDDDDDDDGKTMNNESSDVKIDGNNEDEEEEELALRALLLSRLQSPKYKNNINYISKCVNNLEDKNNTTTKDEATPPIQSIKESPRNELEPEILRPKTPLISPNQRTLKNETQRKMVLSPGSEILKKAVQRFNQEKELAKQCKSIEKKNKAPTEKSVCPPVVIEKVPENNINLKQFSHQENHGSGMQDQEKDSVNDKKGENINTQHFDREQMSSSVVKKNEESKYIKLEHANKENAKLTTLTKSIKGKSPQKSITSIPKVAKKISIATTVTKPTLTATPAASITKRIMSITPKKQQILQRKSFTTYNLLRTAKIVKPNKVINRISKIPAKLLQTFATDNKLVNKSVATNIKMKPTSTTSNLGKKFKTIGKDTNIAVTTKNANSTNETRLITSVEEAQSMFQTPKLVINLRPDTSTGDSTASSSSDEEENSSTVTRKPQFSEKVDQFLQTIRSKTDTQPKSPTNLRMNSNTVEMNTENPANKESSILSNSGKNVNVTPLAVRHLPPSAQAEYRNLVFRMKMLENKRLMKGSKSLFKSKTEASQSQSSTNNQHLYEEMLMKVGNKFIEQCDGTLQLLAKAKELKCSKFVIEKRLNSLKNEIMRVRQLDRDLKGKISALFPDVCEKTKNLTTMRGKFSNLYNLVLSKGKSVNGLTNKSIIELNDSVLKRNEQLTSNIKFINSLRIDNYEELHLKFFEGENKEQISNNNSIVKQRQQQQEQAMAEENNSEEKDSPNEPIAEPILKNTTVECSEMEASNQTIYHHEENVEDNEEQQNKEQHLEEVEMASDLTANSSGCGDVQDKNNDGSLPYESPLECLKVNNSVKDPNLKLCPYALMGQCEDKKCKFWHLKKNESMQEMPIELEKSNI